MLSFPSGLCYLCSGPEFRSEVGQKAKGTAKGEILQLPQAEAGSLHSFCQESSPAKCRAPLP